MPKLTEDITITQAEGWVEIPLIEDTGTRVYITALRNNTIHYRFGATSTSLGTPMTIDESVSSDEALFVRADEDSILTVTKE